MYRFCDGQLEVFLAHPGGPFFTHKDDGHWTLPKGEIEPGEDMLATAIREFKEEIGIDIPADAKFIELGSILQKGGKTVYGWGVEQSCKEPITCKSNFFSMEWPIGSGKFQSYPEVDRAQFFTVGGGKAEDKRNPGSVAGAVTTALQNERGESYGSRDA